MREWCQSARWILHFSANNLFLRNIHSVFKYSTQPQTSDIRNEHMRAWKVSGKGQDEKHIPLNLTRRKYHGSNSLNGQSLQVPQFWGFKFRALCPALCSPEEPHLRKDLFFLPTYTHWCTSTSQGPPFLVVFLWSLAKVPCLSVFSRM